MIAPPDSTHETMQHALVHTISSLDAAVEMDVDLDETKRQALVAEKPALEAKLTTENQAHQAIMDHDLTETYKRQARVSVGDAVLDYGLRTEKARMKLLLKTSDMPGGADYVYGADISELTNTALRREPQRVLEAVARFAQVPDFDGKADSKSDVEGRANRQEQALTERDQAAVTRAGLRSALVRTIADSSDALWTFGEAPPRPVPPPARLRAQLLLPGGQALHAQRRRWRRWRRHPAQRQLDPPRAPLHLPTLGRARVRARAPRGSTSSSTQADERAWSGVQAPTLRLDRL